MTFAPVRLLTVFYEPEEGRRLKVGRLAAKDGEVLFEYDAQFLETGLALSPFKLPLRPGVAIGDPGKFGGLMGLFDDSLPDGWGRLLMDRRAVKAGLAPAAMGPLDRLSLIGGGAMGALVYEPAIEVEIPSVVKLSEISSDVEAVIQEGTPSDLERLIALGGSPQGARPKVLLQMTSEGSILYGDRRSRPGHTHYLVKFRARDDDPYAGVLEHAYALMAAAAGIDVPPTVLLGRSRSHPGYFAIRRFDREGRRKLHLHTLAGLLHTPHVYPSVTYQDLLLTARQLTRSEAAVTELYRRACFNVLAHNRDDHSRNFAFLMTEDGQWRESPAYDLTYSSGPGGEHAMLVGRAGANPTQADLKELARAVGIKRPEAVLAPVRAAVDRFRHYADEAGLPKRATERVAKALGVAPPSRPKHRR